MKNILMGVRALCGLGLIGLGAKELFRGDPPLDDLSLGALSLWSTAELNLTLVATGLILIGVAILTTLNFSKK